MESKAFCCMMSNKFSKETMFESKITRIWVTGHYHTPSFPDTENRLINSSFPAKNSDDKTKKGCFQDGSEEAEIKQHNGFIRIAEYSLQI